MNQKQRDEAKKLLAKLEVERLTSAFSEIRSEQEAKLKRMEAVVTAVKRLLITTPGQVRGWSHDDEFTERYEQLATALESTKEEV